MKLIPNFECFGNEKSAAIQTAHISMVTTDSDQDPYVKSISFCNTGDWAATNGSVQSELAHLFQTVKLYPVPWLSGEIMGVRWKIRPSC